MISLRWTGRGWLAAVPIMPAFAMSLWLVAKLDMRMEARVLVLALLFTGLGVVIDGLLGWLLNSTRTPQGRRWHNRHTLWELPVQYAGLVHAAPSLIFVALALGRGWSPLLGWVAFLIGAPALIALMVWLRGRSERPRFAAQAPGPVAYRFTETGRVIDGKAAQRH